MFQGIRVRVTLYTALAFRHIPSGIISEQHMHYNFLI